MNENLKEEFIQKAMSDPDLSEIKNKKKKLQLYAVKVCRGNITKAALMLGLSRFIFYKNQEDEKYKACIDDIKTVVNDMVDDALLTAALSQDVGAIVWWDKTRGQYKHMNTQKVDHTTNGEKIEGNTQLIFLSADKCTQEEIDSYKKKFLHVDSDNEST